MKHLFILIILLIGYQSVALSQKQVRKDIREGNKAYRQENYTDAEIGYRRALENNARSNTAAYNLGNSLYKQEKFQEALEQYESVIANETDKEKLAMAWHNTGNVFMAAGDYPKSIEAYKNALRQKPQDDETRYNLALAQKLLEEQEQEQEEKKDQKEDPKEDQQQEQEKQEQQDQQKQNSDKDQKQEQQDQQNESQQNSNGMSKNNADQILDALMQDEKNTQEKVKAEQMKQQRQRKTDKNW